jgi:hypothetical protein
MANAWLQHVAKFRQKNQSLSFKQLLKSAKKSYKGGDVKPFSANNGVSRYATTIGGRRKSRRNKRSRR